MKSEQSQTKKKIYLKTVATISNYCVLINGKITERKIKGWQNALTHARRYTANLFENNTIEILNIWTGEIITLEEAERRAKKYCTRQIKTAIQ